MSPKEIAPERFPASLRDGGYLVKETPAKTAAALVARGWGHAVRRRMSSSPTGRSSFSDFDHTPVATDEGGHGEDMTDHVVLRRSRPWRRAIKARRRAA